MKYGIYIGIVVLLMSCRTEEIAEQIPEQEVEHKTDTVLVNEKGEKREELQYFPNGKIKIFGKYENGKRTGLWAAFFDDGRKNSETEYVNGEKHGKSLVWYSNGELFYQGYYERNEKVGLWKFYSRKGKMEREVDYTNEVK